MPLGFGWTRLILKNQWLKMKKGWDFIDKIMPKKQKQQSQQRKNKIQN